jgi:outer membrane protein OmpA-like peptidoglycan-associated protein
LATKDDSIMAGQPKAPFYVTLAIVVVALVAYSAYRFRDVLAPAPKEQKNGPIDVKQIQGAESPNAEPITTVKEYKYVPSERLPPVKGISKYDALKDNTIRFAINVWAGWAPIILANEGTEPKKAWKTPDGEEFKVELVIIDNPIDMRDAYSTGQIHIGWATVDMVPLFMRDFATDPRVMPRIFQQIDWSNGGDGIVVRENIKTVGDLRGKTIVLAQNSPSHYFALNMLVAGGVQPSEVTIKSTTDAFAAAAAFNGDKSIAGAVSWSPDIYNLAKVKGNRMLVTTQTANKLIADIWFARADFAKDHPGMIEALVRGIFDAMTDMKDDAKRAHCADLMASAYKIKAEDATKMFDDAHNTNWAENYQFFKNQNNPANFEHVWRQSYYLYTQVQAIDRKQKEVPFDQVADFSVIDKLGQEPKYKNQKDEYGTTFVPKTVTQIQGESEEILTNTIVIRFFPNSWDLHKKITKEVDGKTVETLYDPNVDNVLKEAGALAAEFGGARIIIVGHTDSSMRGQVPADVVKELSDQRANAVKEALVGQFKIDPARIAATGVGWDQPADPNDPENHAKNRRVEIKVYTAEKQ